MNELEKIIEVENCNRLIWEDLVETRHIIKKIKYFLKHHNLQETNKREQLNNFLNQMAESARVDLKCSNSRVITETLFKHTDLTPEEISESENIPLEFVSFYFQKDKDEN